MRDGNPGADAGAARDRFICWYRQQIQRIESGEISELVRLVYEDDELDLPRHPGPDAVELRWRKTPVHLELVLQGHAVRKHRLFSG